MTVFSNSEIRSDVAESEKRLKDLFDASYDGLVYFAFRIMGDRSEAEDIVQDAFVKYWRQQDEVAPEIPAVKSYLYTIVRNSCYNWIRHRQVVRSHEATTVTETVDDGNVLQVIMEAEVLAAIHHALAALPPVCREITRLSHLEGKKNEEIAAMMGISVNSVKTQKQRGLQLLRKKLSPEALFILLAFQATL